MAFSPIVPDATTPSEDREQSRKEHFVLFGHFPLPNLATGQCCHPVHDALRRMIESPGVHVIIPFDHQDVIPDNDARVVALERAYQRRVVQFKDRIAYLEKRKEFREQKERG